MVLEVPHIRWAAAEAMELATEAVLEVDTAVATAVVAVMEARAVTTEAVVAVVKAAVVHDHHAPQQRRAPAAAAAAPQALQPAPRTAAPQQAPPARCKLLCFLVESLTYSCLIKAQNDYSKIKRTWFAVPIPLFQLSFRFYSTSIGDWF